MLRRWMLLTCLLAFSCGDSPPPGAGAGAGDSLVLMAWNAEFLWDGEAPEDGDADFPWKGSAERAGRHMAAVAEVIRRHDPDLVSLAEVEDRRALETLASRYLGDLGYRTYLVDGTDTATGQDMGLLSRLEIQSMGRDPRRGRSGKTRKGVSKHYVATLDAGSLRLGLVGLHLLARPDRESRRAPREAQADAVRGMALELAGQGRSLIIWGDFNDFDAATPDADSSRPITRVLEWVRAMDPGDPRDDLVNIAHRLPKKERYTTERAGRNHRRSAVDHVLVSPELADRITRVAIPRHDLRQVSDHYPIVFELSLD